MLLINNDYFSQYRKKEKIKISDQNDTINYILRKTFFFNKEESGCHTPEDEVTVLNAALVVNYLFQIFLKYGK